MLEHKISRIFGHAIQNLVQLGRDSEEDECCSALEINKFDCIVVWHGFRIWKEYVILTDGGDAILVETFWKVMPRTSIAVMIIREPSQFWVVDSLHEMCISKPVTLVMSACSCMRHHSYFSCQGRFSKTLVRSLLLMQAFRKVCEGYRLLPGTSW